MLEINMNPVKYFSSQQDVEEHPHLILLGSLHSAVPELFLGPGHRDPQQLAAREQSFKAVWNLLARLV